MHHDARPRGAEIREHVADTWLVDRDFGPWRVQAFLAEGGMARLWQVRHGETGALGALKVSRSRDPELLARATREAKIQQALRHPNVLGALDVVDVEGTPGIVLELVEGGLTLESELRSGPLRGEALERAVHGLLDGVEAAHRAGFIHRDLKPANVLLQPAPGGWIPRLADFGLARPEFEPPEAKMTRAGFILGSAAYMAPEQARDAGSVDARADLWSIGVMIYEMIAGEPPFQGETVEEVLTNGARIRYRPLDSLVPDVAPRWQVAIEACLHGDPDMRVPDVATLREVLRGERRWVSEAGGARRRSFPGVAAPRLPDRRTPPPAPATPAPRPADATFPPEPFTTPVPRTAMAYAGLAAGLIVTVTALAWALISP